MFVPQQQQASENGINGHAAKPKAVFDREGHSYTDKDLDQAIEVCVQLARDQIANGWHFGKKVDEIYSKGLWKTRGRYETFDQFATAELPLKAETALRWMNIARKFSEEEVRNKPVELLRELATLNDGDAKALLRSYDTKELTTAEVRKKAKELKRANKGDAGQKAKPGVSAANMARAQSEERMTVQLPATKKHYVLNAKGPKGSEPIPATSIEQNPYVQIPCQRGVYLLAQVSTNKDGTLRLTVQPMRAD